ncbi:MAG TPA: sigma 54-interacting transcriptional regulator, partial [Verrucomicrobiae bacterium]|nr:sigma 54-interacting transcriptional regulator [Verrucomicrobiae bacterium]
MNKLNPPYEILTMVLDQLDVGIHVIDRNGKTILYNRKMAELESISPEEIKGKDIRELLPLDPEESTLLTAVRTGRILEDRKQSYITGKGNKVTTVNRTLPLYSEDQLFGAMEVAKDITYIKQLADQLADLQEELHRKQNAATLKEPAKVFSFSDILGSSAALKECLTHAERAAHSASTVLIYGETGTGKELFAQSIHSAGSRAKLPFVAQNCAALPETLLEGILFGTTKGSFTGAVNRPGLFELAAGGTLLLDEIHSMGLGLQAKLLRVIQDKKVRRLGSTQEIPVDVRIIATCNIEPEEAVQQNLLREDLYFRLNVVTLAIPPLRERKADIPGLALFFLAKHARALRNDLPDILPQTLDLLMSYPWPGNVRELENLVEGTLNILPAGEAIAPTHLPAYFRRWYDKNPPQDAFTLRLSKAEFERKQITLALKTCQGNITQTAALLGISRQALQYK